MPPSASSKDLPPGARIRAERKQLQRSERELGRLEAEIDRLVRLERELGERMAVVASDHVELVRLQTELEGAIAERERLETAWLQTSESLEG